MATPTLSPSRSFRRRAPAGESQAELQPRQRRRNTPSVALGILLILVCGMGAAVLVTNAGERSSVLITSREVPAGSRIDDAALTTARISVDPGLRAIPATARSRVVGRVAKVGLVPGTLLTPQHLAQTRVIPPGQSIVAVPLKTGQAPRIDTGDEVLVVPTGGSTSDSGGSRPLVAGGTASTRTARVQGIDRDESGDLIVSLLVEESAAPFIAAAASTGDISLVLRSSRP